VTVTVSIGIAEGVRSRPDDLLRDADIASTGPRPPASET